jgi:hypothetical protein
MDERRSMHLATERRGTGRERYECAAHETHVGRAAIEQIDDLDDHDSADTGRPSETWRLLAEQLEPRIDGMSCMVEGLHAAPYYVAQAESGKLVDPVNDLRVKVEAVRWMLRIAKHLNGVAREMVMATVARSVNDLETVVETQTRVMAQRAAA